MKPDLESNKNVKGVIRDEEVNAEELGSDSYSCNENEARLLTSISRDAWIHFPSRICRDAHESPYRQHCRQMGRPNCIRQGYPNSINVEFSAQRLEVR